MNNITNTSKIRHSLISLLADLRLDRMGPVDMRQYLWTPLLEEHINNHEPLELRMAAWDRLYGAYEGLTTARLVEFLIKELKFRGELPISNSEGGTTNE